MIRLARLDLKFVNVAIFESWEEQLPDPRAAAHAHRVPAPVPLVEIADHADPPRVGRPDGETDAADPFDGRYVRAQLLVGAMVCAFSEQMEVVIRKDRGEPVGVFKLALAAVSEPDAQAIGKDLCRPGERRFKEAVRVNAFKSNDGAWVRSRA